MFPKDVISPVTIYPLYTDPLTGNQIAVRCVLEGCFWNDDSITVFQKTGQQTTNNVTLFLPMDKNITGREYISPEDWNKLPKSDLDKYWTVNPRQLPLMVKGDNTHEFDWASPSAPNRIAIQENNFLSSNPNVRRARDINEQDFGSPKMRHIVIRA